MTEEEARKEAKLRNKEGIKPPTGKFWTVRAILAELGLAPPPKASAKAEAVQKDLRPRSDSHPPLVSSGENIDEI